MNDLSILIFYGISTLLVSGYGLYQIIASDKDEKDRIIDGWMLFLAGFTPGVMIITGFLLCALFMMLVTEGPVYLIRKLKR